MRHCDVVWFTALEPNTTMSSNDNSTNDNSTNDTSTDVSSDYTTTASSTFSKKDDTTAVTGRTDLCTLPLEAKHTTGNLHTFIVYVRQFNKIC